MGSHTISHGGGSDGRYVASSLKHEMPEHDEVKYVNKMISIERDERRMQGSQDVNHNYATIVDNQRRISVARIVQHTTKGARDAEKIIILLWYADQVNQIHEIWWVKN